ncbi:hypothetical protein KBB25_02985 [Candidatus Gracilibacteria bacterium]|nr:hypothetical protein [Candidatus Gracilibacteria bacterium]
MPLDIRFTYILENLLLYHPTWITVSLGIIIGVTILVILRMIFLYCTGLFLLHEDAIALKKKKNTLGDLILMKDIQTELEKEIEQAMLKATFQG